MYKIISTVMTFLALVSVIVTPPAPAAEGQIPIWQPTVLDSTTGAYINGAYFVTRDITTSGTPAIQIIGTGVEEVTVDLNGFTLSCASGGSNVIEAGALGSLTIRNGTVEQGLSGIHVDSATTVVIEDVTVESVDENGIGVFHAANVAIRRNVIVDAHEKGIHVEPLPGGEPTAQSSLEGNFVHGGGIGISVVSGSNALIRNNEVLGTSANGINVFFQRGFQVVGNSVHAAGGSGIHAAIAAAGRIQGNTVYESRGSGIAVAVSDDCLVVDNATSHNAMVGLVVSGDRNQIERNVVNTNLEAGIYINGQDNTFGRNMARGNTGMPSTGCPATMPPCIAPDICIVGSNNSSFGDNMGPAPGC